jgi:hypothetical protein
MRIAFGHRPQSGPWGGGNRFAKALIEALQKRGDEVVYGLGHSGIDIILIVDPRSRNPVVPFTPGAVFRHVLRHPRTLVAHRINECDERKGTHTMNLRLRLANYVADHTIFIGRWLADLDLWRAETPFRVIHNGADRNIFTDAGRLPWDRREPFRLVTHHWGAHANKGFDVYDRLDAMMDEPNWQGRLEFTYIGNMPAGRVLRHARHLQPMDGRDLAAELRRHHGYVTASLNEPAGMHHIEGALCGLPLLFRNSGALPEYCAGFGEMFENANDVGEALSKLLARYDMHCAALLDYPHDAERMCRDYLSAFDFMIENRQEFMARRRPWRDPLSALLIQLPW